MKAWWVALALTACTAEVAAPATPQSAVAHGVWLFSHRDASPAASNIYTCATCHNGGGGRQAGLRLDGVVHRPSWWGGGTRQLLDAINLCRFWFMDAQQPWGPTDEAARAMWAYLESLPATLPDAQTWTVVATIGDVAAGQASVGATVYTKACAPCHGQAHTGKGRLSAQALVLPEQFVASHSKYSATERRLTCIEKVRHGPFLGYGGKMPPFALEVLSDGDLANLLAYLGL